MDENKKSVNTKHFDVISICCGIASIGFFLLSVFLGNLLIDIAGFILGVAGLVLGILAKKASGKEDLIARFGIISSIVGVFLPSACVILYLVLFA